MATGATGVGIHAGKGVVITGGASGIGRGCAERFVREGARVLVIDRDQEGLAALASDFPDDVLTTLADVTDEVQIEAAFDHAVASFGGIDVCINNAGIIQPFVNVEDLDFDTEALKLLLGSDDVRAGEVFVVDWGLAFHVGGAAGQERLHAGVERAPHILLVGSVGGVAALRADGQRRRELVRDAARIVRAGAIAHDAGGIVAGARVSGAALPVEQRGGEREREEGPWW